MSQQSKIMAILSDQQKHCSVEFLEKMFIVDYRRRICDIREELRPQGQTVASEPCKGRCGRNHSAGMHRYWLERIGATSLKFNDLSDKFEVLTPKKQPDTIQAQQPRLFKPSVVRY
jgi:hypothetical protein